MNRKIHLHRCKFQHIAPYWNGAPCFGTCWRLYYNLTRGGSVLVRGEPTELVPDHLYLMPPGLSFSTRVEGDPKQFFLHFDVNEPFDRVHGKVYPIELDLVLRSLLDQTMAAVLPPPDFLTERGSLHAVGLIGQALSRIPDDCVGVRPLDNRVAAAVERFSIGLGETVKMDAEARAQGLSRAAFIRLFKRETGETPYVYLTRMRIAHACELLKKSEMTIELVAEYTGFSDRFHFSKVFKQLTGTSPATYRRSEME